MDHLDFRHIIGDGCDNEEHVLSVFFEVEKAHDTTWKLERPFSDIRSQGSITHVYICIFI